MKLFCEALTMGFCSAGAYGLTVELFGTLEKSFSGWAVFLFLVLIAHLCVWYISKGDISER